MGESLIVTSLPFSLFALLLSPSSSSTVVLFTCGVPEAGLADTIRRDFNFSNFSDALTSGMLAVISLALVTAVVLVVVVMASVDDEEGGAVLSRARLGLSCLAVDLVGVATGREESSTESA